MIGEELNWMNRGGFNQYGKNRIFKIQEGTGENLLIIQGLGTTSTDWEELVEPLTQRFRIILPELLGTGFSDKPKRYKFSIQDSVNQIRYLLKKNKISSFHILAHDFGIQVALLLIKLTRQSHSEENVLSAMFILDENFKKPRSYSIHRNIPHLILILRQEFIKRGTIKGQEPAQLQKEFLKPTWRFEKIMTKNFIHKNLLRLENEVRDSESAAILSKTEIPTGLILIGGTHQEFKHQIGLIQQSIPFAKISTYEQIPNLQKKISKGKLLEQQIVKFHETL